MQSVTGEWWREFRTYVSALNLHFEGIEAQQAAVNLRKQGFTPLNAIRELQKRNLATTPQT